VLLDEPLSNLDARLRLEMRDEIRRIHAETGTTMVYVTHDQQEALSMADRLSVMNLGSVIQTDDPQTIYTRPTSAFVADFIGETNLIMGKLKSAKATAADTLDPVDSTVVADARDTANSSLVIETAVGQLHSIVYPVTDLFPGDEVVCSIRPESLQILHTGETKAEGQNLLHATVCQAMYLGSHEQYLVKLVDDTQIKLVDYHPERHRFRTGETIHLTCEASQVVVLPNIESSQTPISEP